MNEVVEGDEDEEVIILSNDPVPREIGTRKIIKNSNNMINRIPNSAL
jgi:hypothetical protein